VAAASYSVCFSEIISVFFRGMHYFLFFFPISCFMTIISRISFFYFLFIFFYFIYSFFNSLLFRVRKSIVILQFSVLIHGSRKRFEFAIGSLVCLILS